jgi:cell division transport system permease protein
MLLFWIKESFRLIGRAKSYFFMSFISISISILLIIASVVLFQISEEFQEAISKSAKINIFLKESSSEKENISLRQDLEEMNYFSSIEYIDKEKAAEIFIKETGEDFRRILDYNPLPASYVLTLKSGLLVQDSIKMIAAELSKLKQADEVVYHDKFIAKIINYLYNIKKYVFIITAVLVFISVYIVYSTIKLIMRSKYNELETMKLVGAKLSTIKMPIILNAIFIGFIASLLSLALIMLFTNYFDPYIGLREFLSIKSKYNVLLVLIIGPVLALVVTIFSLRKISLKI